MTRSVMTILQRCMPTKSRSLLAGKTVGLLALLCTFTVGRLSAQDVIVTVTPVQQVLPPQVMMYLAAPHNYFTVTLTSLYTPLLATT